MTDPLPAATRCLLEDIAAGKDPFLMMFQGRAQDELAKYPRSQPEPAWLQGDVVLWHDMAWRRRGDDWVRLNDNHTTGDYAPGFSAEADLIARGGRRVYPPRFAEHASWLRRIAAANFDKYEEPYKKLHRIAADLAGDTDA
jgi:hypothetical protein